MLRLDKIIKPWKESASLNDHINLYGFWNETTFLTKSGDVGMVLSVPGVDYESLDRSEQEYAVKRLEAALKAFGPGFHVYQYLFKSNCPDIPPPEKITGDGRGSSARHSSGLRFQFFRVEVFSLLPKSQRNGRYLACQRQTRHGWLDQGNPGWLRGPKRKSAERQK